MPACGGEGSMQRRKACYATVAASPFLRMQINYAISSYSLAPIRGHP